MSATAVIRVDEALRDATISVLRERGFPGLTLERVADFRETMYPILTAGGSGRDRLERGLVALCRLLDRHLPLMLATDEAFHQETAPGEPANYLHPFIQFL